MCGNLYLKYTYFYNKIATRFNSLFKIIRVITLLDATLGLIILVILLIRRIKKSGNELSVLDYNNYQVRTIVLMGLQVLEIIFALVLHEGVRREIFCMTKIWFFYCLTRFTLLIIQQFIFPMWISDQGSFKKSKIQLWIFGAEGILTLFHIIQCVILFTMHRVHKQDTNNRNNSDEISNRNSGCNNDLQLQEMGPTIIVDGSK